MDRIAPAQRLSDNAIHRAVSWNSGRHGAGGKSPWRVTAISNTLAHRLRGMARFLPTPMRHAAARN